MITKFPIEDNLLIVNLHNHYAIETDRLEFIPIGDSAYSYRVDCVNGQQYYLKLFDHQNERQDRGVARLSYYLPVTWELYHRGVFKSIAYPIKNNNGDYKTSFDGLTMVLFNFIEGETLADAYPFPDPILQEIAELAAAIHQITPKIDLSSLPKETLDISFDASLRKCMKELEHPQAKDKPILLALRDQVLPRKAQILASLNDVTELRSTVRLDPTGFVLCHGDLWGGNMIRHGRDLVVIDWESVIVAPPEYDLFGYMGNGFGAFFAAYEKRLNRTVTLNLNLLRFYSYRTHLRNLTNWLMNLIHGNHTEAQDKNDLEMISDHCLNRFAPIESNILGVESLLKQRDRAHGSY